MSTKASEYDQVMPKPQTTTRHREEETNSIYSHATPREQVEQSNRLCCVNHFIHEYSC